ncbi:MAG: DoxX family protein [Candidatus Taylorbacteria bacterium]|nr:DoxX family protein [Candidatus Taylorbacteria bacterium]
MFKHTCSESCGKWCPSQYLNRDVGILILRVGLGALFIHHGYLKLADMHGTVAFFASIGYGSFLAWLTAIVETVGGLAILLGVFQGPAAIALAIEMLVIIFNMKWSKGFNAFEFDLIFFFMLVGLALIGRGRYSVLKGSCRTCKEGTCADASCEVVAEKA